MNECMNARTHITVLPTTSTMFNTVLKINFISDFRFQYYSVHIHASLSIFFSFFYEINPSRAEALGVIVAGRLLKNDFLRRVQICARSQET